ncbi:unnamed protein product [Discosporangium mesarthrocarpum]
MMPSSRRQNGKGGKTCASQWAPSMLAFSCVVLANFLAPGVDSFGLPGALHFRIPHPTGRVCNFPKPVSRASHKPLVGRAKPRRSTFLMTTVPIDGAAAGKGNHFRSRFKALFGQSGRTYPGKLQALVATIRSGLRSANVRVRKKALTVALAMTLCFPGLAGHGLHSSDGIRTHTETTVVVSQEASTAMKEPSASSRRAVAVEGGGGTRVTSANARETASGVAEERGGDLGMYSGPWRSQTPIQARTRTAFVPAREGGSWGRDSQAGSMNRAKGGAVEQQGLVAGRSVAVKEELTAQELVRSLAASAVESASQIASEFGGHLKGAKRDLLVILLANALIIPICTRVKLSPILGFLASGILLGPNGLSILQDVKAMEVLGEMGIVFFLFEMGLELSLSRLKAMKRDVFGLGLVQFLLTSAGVAGVASLAGLSAPQLVVIGGGVALSSSAFVLQLLRDRDDLGTRYGRACFGILLFQDLAVVPLLVAIPLLAGGGGGIAAALSSAAIKAAIALSIIAFIGKNVLDRFFLLVAKSKSQEAFLAVILLTVLALSSVTEGLGLSGTLGAFLAGTLLSETKYTPQVEADIAPFRALLLGLFFMTVGFEINLGLIFSNLPLVASLVSGLLALKAATIALICLGFGLSLANAQQTGLLLSQGGEFAFVAFGMAERLGILEPALCKVLLTTVAITMATTPMLSSFSAWVADQIEERMGFSHYVGTDKESGEIRKREEFVVVCGYGRIGRLVCDLLDRKFISYVAFDNNPQRAMEARNRGLPVFYGDVARPEVLNTFNVGKAKAVICTLSEVKGTNKAVVNLRREFPDLAIFARAKDAKHQKRLSSIMNVVSMVPMLPEDSIMVSLPFGGAVLRSLGLSPEEVNILLEDTRKKFIKEKGLEDYEEENIFSQLGIKMKEKEEKEVNPEVVQVADVADVVQMAQEADVGQVVQEVDVVKEAGNPLNAGVAMHAAATGGEGGAPVLVTGVAGDMPTGESVPAQSGE